MLSVLLFVLVQLGGLSPSCRCRCLLRVRRTCLESPVIEKRSVLLEFAIYLVEDERDYIFGASPFDVDVVSRRVPANVFCSLFIDILAMYRRFITNIVVSANRLLFIKTDKNMSCLPSIFFGEIVYT